MKTDNAADSYHLHFWAVRTEKLLNIFQFTESISLSIWHDRCSLLQPMQNCFRPVIHHTHHMTSKTYAQYMCKTNKDDATMPTQAVAICLPSCCTYTIGHNKCGQLLTDFQNSFTGTLCRQFAIMWYLYISQYTVNASLHYLVKYKCKKKLVIITNI